MCAVNGVVVGLSGFIGLLPVFKFSKPPFINVNAVLEKDAIPVACKLIAPTVFAVIKPNAEVIQFNPID